MAGNQNEKSWRMHHVGIVVDSIAERVHGHAESLGLAWDGQIIADPIQKVRVAFLRGAAGDGPLVELVEPAATDSPVNPFLKKGGGLHHLCYEVDLLDAELAQVRSRGDFIAKEPEPAVAFDGRRIAWVFTKGRVLVELLERKKNAQRGSE